MTSRVVKEHMGQNALMGIAASPEFKKMSPVLRDVESIGEAGDSLTDFALSMRQIEALGAVDSDTESLMQEIGDSLPKDPTLTGPSLKGVPADNPAAESMPADAVNDPDATDAQDALLEVRENETVAEVSTETGAVSGSESAADIFFQEFVKKSPDPDLPDARIAEDITETAQDMDDQGVDHTPEALIPQEPPHERFLTDTSDDESDDINDTDMASGGAEEDVRIEDPEVPPIDVEDLHFETIDLEQVKRNARASGMAIAPDPEDTLSPDADIPDQEEGWSYQTDLGSAQSEAVSRGSEVEKLDIRSALASADIPADENDLPDTEEGWTDPETDPQGDVGEAPQDDPWAEFDDAMKSADTGVQSEAQSDEALQSAVWGDEVATQHPTQDEMRAEHSDAYEGAPENAALGAPEGAADHSEADAGEIPAAPARSRRKSMLMMGAIAACLLVIGVSAAGLMPTFGGSSDRVANAPQIPAAQTEAPAATAMPDAALPDAPSLGLADLQGLVETPQPPAPSEPDVFDQTALAGTHSSDDLDLSDLFLTAEPVVPVAAEPETQSAEVEAVVGMTDFELLIGSVETIDANTQDLFDRASAQDQRITDLEDLMVQALERAERAEALALAQNQLLVRFVATEEKIEIAETLIVDLSRRIATVEGVDAADRAEVDARLEALDNTVRGLQRDVGMVARMAINGSPAAASGRTTPGAANFDRSTDVALRSPVADPANVPADAAVGDFVNGYGIVLEIFATSDGGRMVVMENGSVIQN